MNMRRWDIFCQVIDNFGDIGVCWRLAADLAARGQQVRLWVDDASALGWMAPAGHPDVQVLAWAEPLDTSSASLQARPVDVLIEAFGCDIPARFLSACADLHGGHGQPVWINLEYLSAEAYVARSHGLPSPVQTGPAAGWTKWFFYPGFTQATGGLLREPELPARQAAFDRSTWLRDQGVDWRGETLVSLFCYEPAALAGLLRRLQAQGLEGQPVRLLVAAGRASDAVRLATEGDSGLKALPHGRSLLSIAYLPLMSQADFDHLLWACDLNFVRGEDSIVRAIWAGKPFVWQLYPQEGGAHLVKLEAFLDAMHAPASWRAFNQAWNAGQAVGSHGSQEGLVPPPLASWQQAAARQALMKLMAQDDLTTRLIEFVQKSR